MRLKSSIHPAHFGLRPGVKPVRARKKRGLTPSWDGKFSSHKALGPAPFESLLERDCQTLLTAMPWVKWYAVQSHRLIYWAPDAEGVMVKRSYTPDIVAVSQAGEVVVIEVKGKALAAGARWRQLEPHIREAYRIDHGVRFEVFTEDTIRAQPRLNNCQEIIRFRNPHDDVQADLAIRDSVSAHRQTTLGAVLDEVEQRGIDVGRSYPAAMRMVLAGELTLDLSTPISTRTPVRA